LYFFLELFRSTLSVVLCQKYRSILHPSPSFWSRMPKRPRRGRQSVLSAGLSQAGDREPSWLTSVNLKPTVQWMQYNVCVHLSQNRFVLARTHMSASDSKFPIWTHAVLLLLLAIGKRSAVTGSSCQQPVRLNRDCRPRQSNFTKSASLPECQAYNVTGCETCSFSQVLVNRYLYT
jgi:hypothetical protein